MHEQYERYLFEVEIEDVGERIDRFLTLQGEGWSRTQIQGWIKDEFVTVNDQIVKANYKLEEGDVLRLSIPPNPEVKILPEPIALEVVYEDDDVLIINKPRGMVVHPAPGNFSGTLVNALLYHTEHLSNVNGILRPGIVHRIDKDTSGILMVAKNDEAHHSLAAQLKGHSVERKYIALVHGLITHETGTIDAPIGRSPKDRKKMAVVHANGKEAITHFVVLEHFDHYTLVECQLETGRTHQIRVHMEYIGHPVVGDQTYRKRGKSNSFGLSGQALHARVLGFTHPRTYERLHFETPIPQDFEEVLQKLRSNREI